MPWQFTAPVAVGDLDPNGPYTQCKIVRLVHDSNRARIRVDIEYGNTVEGVWIPGLDPTNKQGSFMIDGEDYLQLVTTSMPEQGELTYNAVKRGIYDHLSTKGVIDAGIIV